MEVWLSLAIVFGILALADYLGIVTKAMLSSVFVIMLVFLVGFLTGILPDDIIAKAKLTEIGSLSAGYLIFNMGSNINIREMIKEWKIVVMAIFAMAVAIAGVLVISPIIGFQEAIVAIPIVNGGIVAALTMTNAATEAGLPIIASLGLFVYAVQKFFGSVPASRCGLNEGKILVKQYRESLAQGIDLLKDVSETDQVQEKKVKFSQKYSKYYTTYTSMFIASLTIVTSVYVSSLTGVSYSIWVLILSMLLNQLGVLPNKILDNAKVSGILMAGTIASMVPSLAAIEISDLSSLAFKTVLIFAAVIVAVFLVLYILPGWKLIGSRNLAIGIAMSQLLGFPYTMLIVNEVATAVGETQAEQDYVVKKLTPAFVVSGFVSVTTLSVLIAGIFVNWL